MMHTTNIFPNFVLDSIIAGSGKGQLDQPMGAIIDNFNNILVADSRNHRIQLISDEGKFEKSILTKEDGLKLPMALWADTSGYLYIAEYQGNIKIFRYMEAAVDLLPVGKPIPVDGTDLAPELVTISCTQDTVTVKDNGETKVEGNNNIIVAHTQNGSAIVPTVPCEGFTEGTELVNSQTLSSPQKKCQLNTIQCTDQTESVL